MNRPPSGPGRTVARRSPIRSGTAHRPATTRPATARRDSRRPGRCAVRRPREAVPRYWFADRLLAVLTGRRPVHSLLSHTVGEAYEQLVRLAPADEPFLPPGREPSVRHCDEYAPRDGVVEAFARISSGDRVHALAFRLERGPDLRWRCAAVEADGRHRERAEP
ncbi:Rv3235 family protein [Streptomyces sp. NEAU-PBA10]|uniref:Rv3235 family protein n=1 Tax=Streptomyces TaxID=1883 RepID=UPI00189D0D7E|nr:Rv3235 family protein [Streptomyces albidoflavus]